MTPIDSRDTERVAGGWMDGFGFPRDNEASDILREWIDRAEGRP